MYVRKGFVNGEIKIAPFCTYGYVLTAYFSEVIEVMYQSKK